MRKKFTTTLDEQLITKIKIKAIEENTDVSKLLEKLILKYLKSENEVLAFFILIWCNSTFPLPHI